MRKSVAGPARNGTVFGSAESSSTDASSLYATDGTRKYLNDEERDRLLKVLSRRRIDQRLFVLTLFWTGARISEVLALHACSFQAQRGIVAIRTLKRRRHSVREIPVPPALMASLCEHFQLGAPCTAGTQTSARLWPWHRQTAWRYVKEIMAEAGIVGRAASPRGLRHAFGVGSLQAGVPLNLVQRWMGHSRMTTTAIYTAVSGAEERAFAEALWNRMEIK